ncbi:MAG: MOSC domain-containing protein [Arenibacterium sp.]
MTGQVLSLATYPIKGLSPEPLDRVRLVAQNGFPGDRMFAFAKGNSGQDTENPKILPKDRYLVLLQHAKLAGLHTTFDPETQILTINTSGQPPRVFDKTLSADKVLACDYLSDLLDLRPEEYPFFVSAAPLRFTDVSVVSPTHMNAVSLINLASVRAFAQAIGEEINPARFRGNILIDGWPPLAELELVGKDIQIGTARFHGLLRTQRCAATEVNPDTAERDIPLPYKLMKTYGHRDMGLYMEVVEGGEIKTGDAAEY